MSGAVAVFEVATGIVSGRVHAVLAIVRLAAGVGTALKARRADIRIALSDPGGSGLHGFYAHGEIDVTGSSITEGIGNSRITANMERGLAVARDRNALCEPLVNLCGDLMAVLAKGGELAPVLEAHADSAQHEQRRLLRQQGQDNTQQMSYVVAATTLVVIFLLVAGPAMWTVVTSLGGL